MQESGERRERKFHTHHRQEPADLESRLTSYYGPPLTEEPLSPSAWLQLRDKLSTQTRQPRNKAKWQSVSRRSRSGRHPVARSGVKVRRFKLPQSQRQNIPAYIQEGLVRVLSQARSYRHSPTLRCVPRRQAARPTVRAPWLLTRGLKLILPARVTRTIEPAELDVLLASALARILYMRRAAPIALSLSMFACLLMALFSLTASIYNHRYLIALPIAVGAEAIMTGLRYRQKRSMVFRADALMVSWLGRSRVCQGLHAMAKYGYGTKRRPLGEPTLAERIHRVCGAPITIENERLTLVR